MIGNFQHCYTKLRHKGEFHINKIFKTLDEGFICGYCMKETSALGYSSRDHCPHCLCSIHVDINPGDRLNSCRGKLIPIGLEKAKKGYKIIYKCEKCNAIKKNSVANDDDYDLIIQLSSIPINYQVL